MIFVTKVSVILITRILRSRSACFLFNLTYLYQDTRILNNNIIYKSRQPLMSVNYKQGINGVCKAVFVFVAHRLHRCHSKRRQHCQNHTVPRSIPIGDQASAAEKNGVRRGVVETITHRCTETE